MTRSFTIRKSNSLHKTNIQQGNKLKAKLCTEFSQMVMNKFPLSENKIMKNIKISSTGQFINSKYLNCSAITTSSD